MQKKKVDSIRCLSCKNRFDVELHVEKTKCPHCGKEWIIEWPWPDECRIVAEA